MGGMGVGVFAVFSFRMIPVVPHSYPRYGGCMVLDTAYHNKLTKELRLGFGHLPAFPSYTNLPHGLFNNFWSNFHSAL